MRHNTDGYGRPSAGSPLRLRVDRYLPMDTPITEHGLTKCGIQEACCSPKGRTPMNIRPFQPIDAPMSQKDVLRPSPKRPTASPGGALVGSVAVAFMPSGAAMDDMT
jgi:hypothetical protein